MQKVCLRLCLICVLKSEWMMNQSALERLYCKSRHLRCYALTLVCLFAVCCVTLRISHRFRKYSPKGFSHAPKRALTPYRYTPIQQVRVPSEKRQKVRGTLRSIHAQGSTEGTGYGSLVSPLRGQKWAAQKIAVQNRHDNSASPYLVPL
jgi:hypothetical protein